MLNLNLDNMTREQLLELAGLTTSFASEKDCKFYLYQPNPVMYYFHTSPVKDRAIFGGNRSGKTNALIEDFAMTFLGEAPDSLKGLIPEWRLNPSHRCRINMIDYPNAFTKTIWPYIEQYIPASSISDVIKDQGRIKAITNQRGGFLEFMQYEQDVKKFQGSSRHRMGYDEEPPKSIFDENNMRLVDTDGENAFSLTPVSEIDKPVLWIADEIYLKASRIVERVDGVINDTSNPKGDQNIHVFFSNIYDNIAISKEAADRILSKYPEEERLVRMKGHFLFMSGRVYKEFNDATHLIDDFEWWKRDGTLYLAIDTHPRTPTAVLLLWVDKYDTKYLVDELFVPLGNLPKFIEAVRTKCHGITPEFILIEPAAYVPDPSNGSCLAFDLIESGLNNPMPMRAPKDLENGIVKTQDALRVGDNGKPSIYICRGLTRFRYEITHYVWGSWKKDTALTKSEKQRPVDKDDHFMECFYRLILMKPKYVAHVEPEEENLNRRTSGTGYSA